MAIWGRLKQELDRASRAAQGAIDEGRIRLEVFRSRQRADRAAQALGYALYRARQDGRDLAPEDYARHSRDIERGEADIERLERQLPKRREPGRSETSAPSPPPATS
jgi:hypothetical protein